jgi:hypothetical protein
MENTKRQKAKVILDMITQVILDEDKYADTSIEVIALSNALDKLKANKGHLFPSNSNATVEYNITQSNIDKKKPNVVRLNVVRTEEEQYIDRQMLFVRMVSYKFNEVLKLAIEYIMRDPDKFAIVSKYLKTIDIDEVINNPDKVENARKPFEDFIVDLAESTDIPEKVFAESKRNILFEVTKNFSDEDKKKISKILMNEGNPIDLYVSSIELQFVTDKDDTEEITNKIREILDNSTDEDTDTNEVLEFAKTLDQKDDSLWDKRNGVPLLSNFKDKFDINRETLMKKLDGFRRVK